MRNLLTRIALLLALLALAGCQMFRTHAPDVASLPIAPANPAPVANSPANAVKRLMWCWQQRDASTYQDLFTGDYVGIAAPGDSAGNPYRARPWSREDELACAQHLFVGGSSYPAADTIALDYDNVLIAQPDPRPGKDPKWHKAIRSSIAMRVTVTNAVDHTVSSIPVFGYMLFYVVRGDSAAIPAELEAQGVRPDSTRWYVVRWEDETAGSLGASPQRLRRAGTLPTRQVTWFALKAMYR